MSKRARKADAGRGDEAGSEELKDAILAMMVEKFDRRLLTWETVEQALSLVNFEIKQAAMFAGR